MSYAEAAARGATQDPEELTNLIPTNPPHSISSPLNSHLIALKTSRAPRPPQVDVSDTATSSLVDVDSPHVASVPSDFESQSVKTNTQADRIEREEEAEEIAETERERRRNAKAARSRTSSSGCDGSSKLARNKSNPVVLANVFLIAVAGAGLGFGAYQKQTRGELSWRIVGLWSGAVGAAGFVDYWVSKWFFQNKYPPK